MERHSSALRRNLDLALIAAFLIGILAPAVDMFVRPASARSTKRELRDPAPPPEIPLDAHALWNFAPDLDAWWKDGFGLRDRLLFGHNWIKVFLFGVTPSPIIELGRRPGWVFYSGERALECDMGTNPFTPSELDAWVKMLEARRSWLAARGARYLVAWVPSKTVVYPEFAPRGVALRGENRVDQLIHALGPSWKDDLIDLRPSQLAEKSNDRPAVGDWTWYPLGTHWTERGAYAGYRAIVERLRERYPAMLPRARSAYKSETDGEPGDSWASRLYLDGWLQQVHWLFRLQRTFRARSIGRVDNIVNSERFVGVDESAPRMLMFHDSMGPPLRPLLAELFSSATYFWQFDFDTQKVEAAKPDLVIALFSDRSLGYVQPRVTAAEAGADVRATFEQATTTLLHVDADGDSPRFEPQGRADVRVENGATIVETREPEDTILVPRFEPVPGSKSILKLVIDAPSASKLDVFYKTRGDANFSRKRCYQLETHEGQNEVYCELLAPELVGDLRIRPGRKIGRFVIRSLEIRAAEL